jgi:exopolysaccharide production protein ExoQ
MLILILAVMTIAGLVLNEDYGPVLMGLSFLGWAGYITCYLQRTRQYLIGAGVIVWAVPILALVSYMWSEDPDATLRASIETLVMVGVLVVMTQTVPARHLIYCLFTVLAVISIISIPFNNLTYDYEANRTNLTGIFHNKNTFSIFSAVLVITCVAIMFDKKAKWQMQLAAVPFIGLGLMQNVQSHSVAATLCMAVALAWGVLMFTSRLVEQQHKKQLVSFILTMGMFAMIVGACGVYEYSDELLSMVGKDSTLTGRTELWDAASKIIAIGNDSHILWDGVGYHAFWIIGHPQAEYLWKMEHVDSGAGFSFHNVYYEIAIELGWPGVVLGALTIVATMRSVVRWMMADPGFESVFFFTTSVFILVIQTQGYNLFSTFDVWYAVFICAYIYGAQAMRTMRTNKLNERNIQFGAATIA